MNVLSELQRAPALAGAAPAALRHLAERAVVKAYCRGQPLWDAGSPVEELIVIRSGLVKVVRTSPRGREVICGLFGAGEALGDLAILRQIPHPDRAIVATQVAGVILVPTEVVFEETHRDAGLAMSLACGTYSKVTALNDEIDVLTAGVVAARLATLLLRLSDRLGKRRSDGTKYIPVALTRRELADLACTSFETTIRVMTRWRRTAVVTTEPYGFVLRDPRALEHISGALLSPQAAAE